MTKSSLQFVFMEKFHESFVFRRIDIKIGECIDVFPIGFQQRF